MATDGCHNESGIMHTAGPQNHKRFCSTIPTKIGVHDRAVCKIFLSSHHDFTTCLASFCSKGMPIRPCSDAIGFAFEQVFSFHLWNNIRMKLITHWQEKSKFITTADSHEVAMDAKPPFGTDSAMTPKQLVLAGLAGCTGIDVAALMKKHQQPVTRFEIETSVEKSKGVHPEVFTSARLIFRFEGQGIDSQKAIEAVTLSQTKYCGVSAMLSKAFPIHYQIEINGSKVGEGLSHFD